MYIKSGKKWQNKIPRLIFLYSLWSYLFIIVVLLETIKNLRNDVFKIVNILKLMSNLNKSRYSVS